jgi:hypothetical protein
MPFNLVRADAQNFVVCGHSHLVGVGSSSGTSEDDAMMLDSCENENDHRIGVVAIQKGKVVCSMFDPVVPRIESESFPKGSRWRRDGVGQSYQSYK